MGNFRAMGPCYVHKGYFWFDPDHVVSVPVDPETGMPPDVNPHPDGKGADRAILAPICDECVRKVNRVKIRTGGIPIETASQRAARLG